MPWWLVPRKKRSPGFNVTIELIHARLSSMEWAMSLMG
jgi:hypothetical protein